MRFSVGLPVDHVDRRGRVRHRRGDRRDGRGGRGRRASTRSTSPTIPPPTSSGSSAVATTRSSRWSGSRSRPPSTTTVRLQTHVYVAAYRNPFLAAKGVATLDALSGGRVILGVAAGYLRPEFGALGVDFDERNELLDECIEVMRQGLDRGRGRGRRPALQGPRGHDAAASGEPAHAADLGRRQQQPGDAPSGRARRGMGAVPEPGRGGPRDEDAGDHLDGRARGRGSTRLATTPRRSAAPSRSTCASLRSGSTTIRPTTRRLGVDLARGAVRRRRRHAPSGSTAMRAYADGNDQEARDGPRRCRCARRARSARSPTRRSTTRHSTACSSAPGSRRAVGTASRGGSSWCRTRSSAGGSATCACSGGASTSRSSRPVRCRSPRAPTARPNRSDIDLAAAPGDAAAGRVRRRARPGAGAARHRRAPAEPRGARLGARAPEHRRRRVDLPVRAEPAALGPQRGPGRRDDDVPRPPGATPPRSCSACRPTIGLAAVVALGVPEKFPTRLKRRPVEEFATVDRFDGAPFHG